MQESEIMKRKHGMYQEAIMVRYRNKSIHSFDYETEYKYSVFVLKYFLFMPEYSLFIF